MRTFKAIFFVPFVTLIIGSCASQPSNINDICSIFRQKESWYKDVRDAEDKWGVPIPLVMSVIRQESSFRHNAVPPRKKLLGFIPWFSRISSSKGYSQAIDSTWENYKRETGSGWSSRHDFEDSVDFVGWYINKSSKMCKIPKNDAYKQYLAYHEGQVGYNRGTYKKKKKVMQIATKVKKRTDIYAKQLAKCKTELDQNTRTWFGFF